MPKPTLIEDARLCEKKASWHELWILVRRPSLDRNSHKRDKTQEKKLPGFSRRLAQVFMQGKKKRQTEKSRVLRVRCDISTSVSGSDGDGNFVILKIKSQYSQIHVPAVS